MYTENGKYQTYYQEGKDHIYILCINKELQNRESRELLILMGSDHS